mgnify:CR=1 FL=1
MQRLTIFVCSFLIPVHVSMPGHYILLYYQAQSINIIFEAYVPYKVVMKYNHLINQLSQRSIIRVIFIPNCNWKWQVEVGNNMYVAKSNKKCKLVSSKSWMLMPSSIWKRLLAWGPQTWQLWIENRKPIFQILVMLLRIKITLIGINSSDQWTKFGPIKLV